MGTGWEKSFYWATPLSEDEIMNVGHEKDDVSYEEEEEACLNRFKEFMGLREQYERQNQISKEIMKQLYILGNGFDIHHDIPSRYSNYRDWLEENDVDLIERLRNYYDVDDKEWWNQFELELGHPDMEDYIDETAFENEPDYGSDGFRDRDYHAGEIQAEDEIGKLVADIKGTFTEWVNLLPAPNRDKRITLDTDEAFFINFNYTDTLQTLYNVNPAYILSIHGSVKLGTELVLGHNRTYDELDAEFAPENLTPPNDLNDEELAEWYDEMADNGEDYIHQSVRGEVVSQIHNLRKDTENIIRANKKTFEALKDVQIVYIYGLSFSPVDEPYLDEVASRVDTATTKWVISYYSDVDKDNAEQFIGSKGIKNDLVSYVKLGDLLVVKQLELPFEK